MSEMLLTVEAMSRLCTRNRRRETRAYLGGVPPATACVVGASASPVLSASFVSLAMYVRRRKDGAMANMCNGFYTLLTLLMLGMRAKVSNPPMANFEKVWAGL